MNLMIVDGYRASIEYDDEIDMFRGEILGLTGGADFYGRNPRELRTEFKKSLRVFLAVCQEKGIEPRRQYSGKFRGRFKWLPADRFVPELARDLRSDAMSLVCR